MQKVIQTSQLRIFAGEGDGSTFSQEASPASRFLSPGSEEARKMTVSSGRKCCVLSKNSGPLGLLVRMLLESSVWRSTKCFLTWKASGTPAKRLLFRLVPSMPSTGETGYVLLPTVTAQDSGPGAIIGKGDKFRTTKNGTIRKVNQNGADGSVGLARLVQMWATPTAADSTGTTGGGNSRSLRTDVGGQLNPTWVEWLMGFPTGWTDLNA